MDELLDRLQQGEILVGDGATGTILMARGLEAGDCPEALNLVHPEWLREIALSYLEAGADIVSTNTFGGSPLKLSSYGLDGRTEEINRIGVELVRDAVAGKAYVSASCGPTGKLLRPYGDTCPEEMSDGFRRQIGALLEGGADLICVETMTDLTEATLAIRAAKTLAPKVPVMATMTFQPTSRGFFTIMGVSVEKAAEGLEEAGADIIGSNCGNGIEAMVEIARELKKHSQLPVVIQSNAGTPLYLGGKVVYPETPAFMGEKVRVLVEMGVSVIGGCCGTNPEHIRAFRSVVRGRDE